MKWFLSDLNRRPSVFSGTGPVEVNDAGNISTAPRSAYEAANGERVWGSADVSDDRPCVE
jgi:hypothetical protein